MAGLHERAEPTNKLSEVERQARVAVLNGEEFKNLPPSQIVPRLADQGRYLASESTLYWITAASAFSAVSRGSRNSGFVDEPS